MHSEENYCGPVYIPLGHGGLNRIQEAPDGSFKLLVCVSVLCCGDSISMV